MGPNPGQIVFEPPEFVRVVDEVLEALADLGGADGLAVALVERRRHLVEQEGDPAADLDKRLDNSSIIRQSPDPQQEAAREFPRLVVPQGTERQWFEVVQRPLRHTSPPQDVVETDGAGEDPTDSSGLLPQRPQGLKDLRGRISALTFDDIVNRHGHFVHHDQRNTPAAAPIQGSQDVGEEDVRRRSTVVALDCEGAGELDIAVVEDGLEFPQPLRREPSPFDQGLGGADEEALDRVHALVIDEVAAETVLSGSEGAHPEGLAHAPGICEQQVRTGPEAAAGSRRGLRPADEVRRVPVVAGLRDDGVQCHDRLQCT